MKDIYSKSRSLGQMARDALDDLKERAASDGMPLDKDEKLDEAWMVGWRYGRDAAFDEAFRKGQKVGRSDASSEIIKDLEEDFSYRDYDISESSRKALMKIIEELKKYYWCNKYYTEDD